MNDVTPFVFDGISVVRTVWQDAEPWFVGADVCRILEIKDQKQALGRLEEDERGGCGIPTPGGVQEMIIVSEPGLYRLIFRSNKPVAERFKRWLAHEVIPTIRKTGGYGLRRLDIAGHRHAVFLMERLKKESCPTVRDSLHRLLAQTMGALGQDTPPLEAIAPPRPPDILAAFWREVAELQEKGIAINHAYADDLLSIRLVELRRHLIRPITGELRRALKADPRFVANKTVNSAITGGAVKCWVFAR